MEILLYFLRITQLYIGIVCYRQFVHGNHQFHGIPEAPGGNWFEISVYLKGFYGKLK